MYDILIQQLSVVRVVRVCVLRYSSAVWDGGGGQQRVGYRRRTRTRDYAASLDSEGARARDQLSRARVVLGVVYLCGTGPVPPWVGPAADPPARTPRRRCNCRRTIGTLLLSSSTTTTTTPRRRHCIGRRRNAAPPDGRRRAPHSVFF